MLRSGKRLLIVSVHRIQLFKLFDEALKNQESQDRKKKNLWAVAILMKKSTLV